MALGERCWAVMLALTMGWLPIEPAQGQPQGGEEGPGPIFIPPPRIITPPPTPTQPPPHRIQPR